MKDKRLLNLYQSALTFWQFGDWESLSRISLAEAEASDRQEELLLLLLVAHLQLNKAEVVQDILSKLADNCVSSNDVVRFIFSSFLNSVGKASVLSGRELEGLNYFEASINYGVPGMQVEHISSCRASEQLKQLGFKKLFFRETVKETDNDIVLRKTDFWKVAEADAYSVNDPAMTKEVYSNLVVGAEQVNVYALRRAVSAAYKIKMGYWPNIDNPKTFSEKMHWRKFYERNPLIPLLIDKVQAKEYVRTHCPELKIIATQHVSDTVDALAWKAPCLIKLTADSGGLWKIEESASDEEVQRILGEVRRRLKESYGMYKAEWGYVKVQNRVFSEDFHQNPLIDYSFFCFGGRVEIIQRTNFELRNDRKKKQSTSFYRRDFESMEGLHYVNGYANEIKDSGIGARLQDFAVKSVEALSEPFDFVRIDLFFDSSSEDWIFGEFTFYPASGAIIYDPVDYDDVLGGLWCIGSGPAPVCL